MAPSENQSENQPKPKQPLQNGVLCPGIGGAYWSGIVVYFGAEYPTNASPYSIVAYNKNNWAKKPACIICQIAIFLLNKNWLPLREEMAQLDYIKDIAKYGLENDQERLLSVLNELIEHSKKTKKLNFAIQLQSILKDALRFQKTNGLTKVGSEAYLNRIEDKEISELILEKITSDYTLDNIIANEKVYNELKFFIEEHQKIDVLQQFGLPVSNKLLLYGPSGCGKTLASYVIAGELEKMMIVINLGAIVSSKLGETSKNLSKIFKKAAIEDCIIFLDEFDSLGKIRDYSQDHGEMKRVVNTILQLFDYLPQSSIVIAATNQKDMLDEALLRRFDNIIAFQLPNEIEIKKLIDLVLQNGNFKFDNKAAANRIIKQCIGLSYYSIQKTLITAIKRTLFATKEPQKILSAKIDTSIWQKLVETEKQSLNV